MHPQSRLDQLGRLASPAYRSPSRGPRQAACGRDAPSIPQASGMRGALDQANRLPYPDGPGQGNA
jgi:hypothetical protein